MQEVVRAALPSEEDILRRFNENAQWLDYKLNLIEDIVCRRKIKTETKITDVPSVLRLDSRGY